MFKKLLGLLSDASIYGVSTVLGQVISFVLLPLYTKHLMPDDFAVIDMLGIITLLFTPLANLGMTNAIFRRFNLAKDPVERRDVLSTGLSSVVCSSLVLLTVGVLFAPFCGRLVNLDESYGYLVRLSFLTATAYTIGFIPQVMLRADRRVSTIGVVTICKIVVTVSITVWTVVFLQLGVYGVVLANLVAETLFMVLMLGLTYRSFGLYLKPDVWRRMIRYGLPILPHSLQTIALGFLGQWVVIHLLDKHEGGLYGTAVRFALPVSFVVNAIQAAWLPYKFQIHAEDPQAANFFRTSFTYYVAMLGYLWVGVSLWGPEVLRRMTLDDSYHAAAMLVPLAAAIRVGTGIYFMVGSGIELSDDTRPYFLISLSGLVTVAASSFLLVPIYGPGAAFVATSLGWLVMSLVVYSLAQRRFYIPYEWSTVGIFATMSLLGVGCAYLIQPLSFELRLLACTLISLAFPLIEFFVLLHSPGERDRMLILLAKFGLTQRAS